MAEDETPAPVVLLVEDDDSDAALARMALERARIPHELVRARDGVEALDRLHGRSPDGPPRQTAVVLLDLRLPRLCGKQVLKAIRAHPRTEHLPVVVVSGSNQPGDVSECYGLHANSYFRKPMDLDTFTENIALLLFYWLELNAPPGPEEAGRRSRRVRSAGVRPAAGRAVAPSLGGPRTPVLVLDRNPVTRVRTAEALADLAGTAPILGAHSEADAVRQLASSPRCKGKTPCACPSLVLLDIDQHPVDGPELLRAIRRHVDHRLPVVFFTANDDPSFINACYQHLPNSVVRKPESPDDYADTVRLIAHYWLRVNESVPAA